MADIINKIVGAVLAALAVKLLGLNTKRVIHSQAKPVHWIWRGIKVLGKFMFLYGLFAFIINMAVSGTLTEKASISASMFSMGLLLWIIGSVTVFIKGN